MKKKVIAILCVAALVFSLAACSGGKDGKKDEDSASKYNLDYESTELQNMATEKASLEVLQDVSKNWLKGNTMFIPGLSPEAEYTYKDFVEKIGVDATTYNKYIDENKYGSSERIMRQFTWISATDESKKFSAFFEERDGKWLLYGVGSVNL